MSQDIAAASPQEPTSAPIAPEDKPLSLQQRRFAEELAFHDPDKAYEIAGYKPHRGNCHRLARDPRVRAIVDQINRDAAQLAGVQLARIVLEQARIATFNIGDLVEREADGSVKVTEEIRTAKGAIVQFEGLPQVDFSRMTPEHFAAVQEIDPATGKIKFYDKLSALRDLQKMLQPEQVNHQLNAGPSLVDLMRAIDGKSRGLPGRSEQA